LIFEKSNFYNNKFTEEKSKRRKRNLVINPTDSDWSVDVSFNYGKLFRNISATQNEFSALVAQKQNLEKSLDVMGGEMLFNYSINPRFFISGGLAWQQNVLRLDDQFENKYTTLRDNQLLEVIIDQNGNTSNVFGQGEVAVAETFFEKKYLRHQRASLPLLFGWNSNIFPKENKEEGKWKFRIATGVMYAFWVGQRGQTFANSNTDGTYVELSSLPHRTNGLWQVTARVGLEYQFNASFSTYLNCRGDMDLNNIWKKTFGIKERYQQLGLQLGLRKQLKK
ncbi:MAG: hypothetical protein AAF573_05810, partial [Bacteroidota bacterium]